MADLNYTAGRENNEKRAKNWICKVKSVLLRDQEPDVEKCLLFSDLLTRPARDWYNHLSRSMRTSWKALLERFIAKDGGNNGISVGRLYYHVHKQSNETTLEDLYRVNVAAIRGRS